LAAAASAGEGDTLITDPDVLERHGFPRDARNVYLARGAVLDQENSLAEPEEFGTADFGWTTVLGNHHHPTTNFPFGSLQPFAGDVFPLHNHVAFYAQLEIPSGALLKQVSWFGSDSDLGPNGFIRGSIMKVCQTGFPTIGPPVVTMLGSADSPNSENFVFTVFAPADESVNNLSCAYLMSTSFSYDTVTGLNLLLRKIRAGWQRQVSPAPVSATFPNDTPTSHPYFRFIEALAAAGITSGCAPGSFCPNNPITRGEMAVFLAAALGLHWP
jgi:hypothetical protein